MKWCNSMDDTRFLGRCICSSKLLYCVKCKTDAIGYNKNNNNNNKINPKIGNPFLPYGDGKTYWPGAKSLPHACHSCILTSTSIHPPQPLHQYRPDMQKLQYFSVFCVFYHLLLSSVLTPAQARAECIEETHLGTSSSKHQ